MPSALVRPPDDAELSKVLSSLNLPRTITPDIVPAFRARPAPSLDDLLAGQPVSHSECTIKGTSGDIILSIFRSSRTSSEPQKHLGILFIHGGGFFSGNRFSITQNMFVFMKELDAVVVSVEYRFAPEHPDRAPVDDCYTALVWTMEHLAQLSIDHGRVMIAGSSAGGGQVAEASARDAGLNLPNLCAQLLVCPMLDDRNDTVSNKQYVNDGTFSRGSNQTGWTVLLGERCGGSDVSLFAAPARATNLADLPAFIAVGSADVCRDECVAYASLLWTCGVQCELHVWPGAFHRFQAFAPNAALSVISDDTRGAWVRRTFSKEIS
jgi:acetyl esterase/lipase